MASSYTMMLSLHPRRLTNARLWKELHQCVQRAGHKQRNGPCHGPLPSGALASHHVAAAAPANVFMNVWSAVGCAPALGLDALGTLRKRALNLLQWHSPLINRELAFRLLMKAGLKRLKMQAVGFEPTLLGPSACEADVITSRLEAPFHVISRPNRSLRDWPGHLRDAKFSEVDIGATPSGGFLAGQMLFRRLLPLLTKPAHINYQSVPSLWGPCDSYPSCPGLDVGSMSCPLPSGLRVHDISSKTC